MNIAITNVSMLRVSEQEIEKKALNSRDYKVNDELTIKGCMTNEPPLKSIMMRLAANNENLDRVIYIESGKVRQPVEIPYGNEIITKSTGDFLRLLIDEYATEKKLNKPQFEEKDRISIKDEPNKAEVAETVFAVQKRLHDLYQQKPENEDMNVYIESNGGVRYVLTMLLSITRTMENSLDDFHIQEISSMVLYKNPVSILETKEIYDTSQITSIIEEYVNYGRVNSMKKYIDSLLLACKNASIKADAEGLVQHLAQLAEAIQLCRTKQMLTDFYEGGGIGKEIDEFLKKHKSTEGAEAQILRFVMQRIKDEFDVFIYEEYDPDKKSILYLPKVIRWCQEKEFVQQALTLCSERIPEYLFESGKVKLSDEMKALLDKAKTGDYEKSYYFLVNMKSVFHNQLNEAKVHNVLTSVQESSRLPADAFTGLFKNVELTWNPRNNAELNDIAETVSKLLVEINSRLRRGITSAELSDMFRRKGLDSAAVNKNVSVSNNKKSTILGVLQGKSFDKDGETLVPNDNLRVPAMRINKIMTALVQEYINLQTINDGPIFEAIYDQIISKLYSVQSSAFVEILQGKYSQKQSAKFCIKDALVSGHITTDLQDNQPDGQAQLQKILYLYSLCKEQRNFSNHAYVSDDDTRVAMNSAQLNILISALLKNLEYDQA